MEHCLSEEIISQYEGLLWEDEKSEGTIKKYKRDIETFYAYIGEGNTVTKKAVIDYKQKLIQKFEVTTVNSILAALNSFFKRMGWYDCVVRSLKIQREAFRSESKELSKEEYYQLLNTAEKRGNKRLHLLMQAICATGIRVSELKYITVEALNIGRAKVSLKGKTRTVILPSALCRKLRKYAKENEIKTGSIFITRNGKPMHRSNIFREMKKLCTEANVDSRKVFPHNLRHLFACAYYQKEKDISHLADLLGHTSIDTTRIYLTRSSEEQARQIEKMGLVI